MASARGPIWYTIKSTGGPRYLDAAKPTVSDPTVPFRGRRGAHPFGSYGKTR